MEELLDLLQTGEGSIERELYASLLSKRSIYINEDVTDCLIDKVSMQIILMNESEKDVPEQDLEPIKLFLNTYGGSIDTCLHLVDVIEGSRIPIHVEVLGIAASAGLYITIACHKRVSRKNSIFLLHKGSVALGGNTASAEDTMDFYKEQVQTVFDDLIIRKTKITTEELKLIRRNETYCLGVEALNKYGFIDEIIK